jgi:hypothetical protein
MSQVVQKEVTNILIETDLKIFDSHYCSKTKWGKMYIEIGNTKYVFSVQKGKEVKAYIID